MNNRYYKGSSDFEELFGISNEDNTKMFVISESGYKMTIKIDKLTKSRMREIEEFEYIFNEDSRKYLIKNIKFYMQNTDMTYRRKTLVRLKEDLKELEKYKDGDYINEIKNR